MSDQVDLHPAADEQPSTSAIVLIGVLISLVALLLFAVIAAVGWGAGGDNPAVDSRSATAGLPDLQQELAAKLWMLEPSDSSVLTNDENAVSLQFHERGLSGLGPCNAYWASVSVDEDDETLQVTNLRHSERECQPSTMRAEREYFATLRSVRDIDLDDRDHLVLSNRVGDRLSYDSVDARDELTGAWRITKVGGHGRLDPPVDGSEPRIAFLDDGTLVLDTGCNTVRASWALVGEQLVTDTTAASTLKACDEDSGLQAQEELLSRVVDSGVRVHVAGGRLIVLDRFHRVLFVAAKLGSGSS